MTIKLTEVIDLIERCAKSCICIEQLYLTMEWMDDIIVPSKFLDEEVGNILIARKHLLQIINEQKGVIFGIGNIEELNLKTQTIHD